MEVLAAPAAEDGSLRLFLHDLCTCTPPGSVVIHTQEEEKTVEAQGFEIAESQPEENSPVMLPPDLAPCDECVSELYDSSNRRYRHPFISCTACGARYSIINSVPYDRITTTQSELSLCSKCLEEYTCEDDRRLCAQTVCCNDCGPKLSFDGKSDFAAIEAAAENLKSGGVIAVKGVGGYHLACSPFDGDALTRLRRGKKRDEKPFAVMFPSLEVLEQYCVTDENSRSLLRSSARPIVLLKSGAKTLHPLVCRDSAYVGAFLPAAPHQMLLLDLTGPLVMTSGNLSGIPIATDAAQLINMDIDGVLDHDRKINVPLDDSVILPHTLGSSFVRRSRGYVPLPVHVKSSGRDALAAGGDLKACFGLRRGGWCYISQHLGDLEELANQQLYRTQIEHMCSLFKINPTHVVCDKHPGYFSTSIVAELGLPVRMLQHHYAHILSAMAENDFDGECIGIALDGTGYGEDNNIWGFEFLKCSHKSFERLGHLKYTSMPASDSSMKNAYSSAVCHLMNFDLADKVFPDSTDLRIMRAARSAGINFMKTSSAGRLFDAAAYLLGCGEYNHFEGQCAQSLEKLASSCSDAPELTLAVEDMEKGFVLNPTPLFDALVNGSATPAEKALGFHRAIARAIAEGACKIRDMCGITTVALGGGVFQNVLLLKLTVELLNSHGFRVIRNKDYPCGDGGLALGQLYWSP